MTVLRAETFRGIVPAMLTPFTAGGGTVALDRIPPHLRFLETHGADGVLALGTNGEFSALTLEEKRAVCDTVLEHKGGLYVIMGVNVCALPEALELAQHAERGGADALLVAPPFYFPGVEPAGLLGYFRAIFEAVSCPIFLYNIPSFTKIPITDELVRALQAYPHLAGLKDTSATLEPTQHYVDTFPDLRIYCGNDTCVGAAQECGTVGNISACANVIPDWMHDVRRQAQAGADWRAAQDRVDAVHTLCQQFPPRAALKYLLHLRGGPESDVRPPLTSLTDEHKQALAAEAAALGITT